LAIQPPVWQVLDLLLTCYQRGSEEAGNKLCNAAITPPGPSDGAEFTRVQVLHTIHFLVQLDNSIYKAHTFHFLVQPDSSIYKAHTFHSMVQPGNSIYKAHTFHFLVQPDSSIYKAHTFHFLVLHFLVQLDSSIYKALSVKNLGELSLLYSTTPP